MLTRTLPLLLAAALCAGAAQAQTTSVAGEPAWGEKALEVPLAWRDLNPDESSMGHQIYGALNPERIADLKARNAELTTKRLLVGVGRSLDEATDRLPQLQWRQVAGGRVSRIAITSPEAAGLRVGMSFESAPAEMELRFSGSDDPSRVVLAANGNDTKNLVDNRGVYWTPATDGETQFVEIFVPAGFDASQIEVRVPLVSHLIVSTRNLHLVTKIGESDTCNVDTVCRVGALGQHFVNAKNSVARMLIAVGGGFTGYCTGTLLNDTDASTQVPYFFTADHCFDDPSQVPTLTTNWNYEATSCGGNVAAANSQRAGATLLYTDYAGDIRFPPYVGTDVALLRLNTAPPAGAYFSGWDANPLASQADVLAIHHPQGDVKKSSLGQQLDTEEYHNFAGWLSGTTEGGSSGSGLFTLSGSGYQLRGGLFGGVASCANSGDLNNQGNYDLYSRLDVAFPDIQQYLAPAQQTFGPSTGRDYTGPWNVPTEAGWGLTMFQFDPPTNYLFALIFIYDDAGVAKWYEYSGSWTATDVSSGDVLESTAAPWGPTYNPANRAFTPAGTATLTFTSATTANITFTVEGVTRTAAIQMIQ